MLNLKLITFSEIASFSSENCNSYLINILITASVFMEYLFCFSPKSTEEAMPIKPTPKATSVKIIKC